MITIVIIDDHEIVRLGVKNYIHQLNDMRVIGEGGNSFEAIKLYEKMHPDIIIIDIHMPGKSGLQASYRILQSNPEAKIIILSTAANNYYIDTILKIGVYGFITKNSFTTEINNAINSVMKNTIYISQDILYLTKNKKTKNPLSKLTLQEFDIFLLFTFGEDVTTIAKALSLEKKTIYHHKKKLMVKLNAENEKDLLLIAKQCKLYPAITVH